MKDLMDKAECNKISCGKSNLPQLPEALRIPQEFICEQRTVCNGMEGCVAMLLRRIACPYRYSNLIPRFGRPVLEMCMITMKVADLFKCYATAIH